ncbi:hypothetical protein BYT27DRAFT_7093829, partial [Phlegmacium glaucopus]
NIKSKFYPLDDMILNYWFPPTQGYNVCPKWPIPDSRKTINFIIRVLKPLTITNQQPLLLVGIKPPSDFHSLVTIFTVASLNFILKLRHEFICLFT